MNINMDKIRKITNTQEANTYYKVVNELVDKLIKNHKIRPTELRSYFSKNLNSFLENSGLSGVEGIVKVVNDVLDHRYHAELDGVLTFENFGKSGHLFESTLSYEKVLADYFRTSIGHVSLLDEEIHLFKVKDFGERKYCVIMNSDDLSEIENSMINSFVQDTMQRGFTISEWNESSISPIKLWLSEIVSDEKLKQILKIKINKDWVLENLSSHIMKKVDLPSGYSNVVFKGSHNSHFIWEITKG